MYPTMGGFMSEHSTSSSQAAQPPDPRHNPAAPTADQHGQPRAETGAARLGGAGVPRPNPTQPHNHERDPSPHHQDPADPEFTDQPVEPDELPLPPVNLIGPRRGRRLVKKNEPKNPITPQQRLLLLDTWQRSGL